MTQLSIPPLVPNWIGGEESPARAGGTFAKLRPTDGRTLCRAARSRTTDIDAAVAQASGAQRAWAERPVVERADLLRELALLLRSHESDLATIVSAETGKSSKDALGETRAAFELGLFMAGEGRRFFGRVTTSAVPHRAAMVVRQPVGVAGLIISANTPIANVAWKSFPALLCGNGVVLKAAEDAPATAWAFARLTGEAGIPKGVFNVVQGLGEEAGAPLVQHPAVDLVSFTGSLEVGRWIAKTAGERMAKICLELGGKNPFVVCDDGDLEKALRLAIPSAFSNAGQRCASGSRIIVMDPVYDEFRRRLVELTGALRVGPGDEDDLGPVINEDQLRRMLQAVESAKATGARVLVGGHRLEGPAHRDGFYMAPTLIEQADSAHPISREELFGPIACLYRARDFPHALDLANEGPYGLTAAIHTRSLHRAQVFTEKLRTGVVSVNGATYGSEPHMPFGGLKASGNGWREPGPEALDVYSAWKTVYTIHDPEAI